MNLYKIIFLLTAMVVILIIPTDSSSSIRRIDFINNERKHLPIDSSESVIDYVPDAETAIKIADAISVPIYGNKYIKTQRPFTAYLKNGVWTVSGRLKRMKTLSVLSVKIQKSDCKILSVKLSM